jgi:ClpP class serine protease
MNESLTVTLNLKDGGEPCGANPAGDALSMTEARTRASAFDLVASQPWAIAPDMLETIAAIARRENDDVEAVQAKLGRPLQNARKATVRGNTAVIPITGPIFRYANLFTEISGATSLEVLARDFTTAHEDPAVQNIVLDINSPGGQAAGIPDFAAMVRASGKPVVAFIDGTAASAAYWIAAAADEVVISKGGMAGNVGALLTLDVSKDKSRMEIVSSQSPNKRPDATTEQGRAQLQGLVDELAQVFIEDVAAYRGMTPESVIQDWNGGAVFIGEKAVKTKMADRTGTLESVIAELAGGSSKPSTSPSMKGTAMNKEELRAAHPDLCAALVEEGREAGFEAGAVAERKRIQDVEAQVLPGHEKLIASLKFDGKTTGPEAAALVVTAERGANEMRATALATERPAPAPSAEAPKDEPKVNPKAVPGTEAEAKAKYEASAELQQEFKTFAVYWAYAQAAVSIEK